MIIAKFLAFNTLSCLCKCSHGGSDNRNRAKRSIEFDCCNTSQTQATCSCVKPNDGVWIFPDPLMFEFIRLIWSRDDDELADEADDCDRDDVDDDDEFGAIVDWWPVVFRDDDEMGGDDDVITSRFVVALVGNLFKCCWCIDAVSNIF